jgi:general secretion pathway protein J
MNARRRSALGFTLLEMIVVIGIFAVLAAMAYGGLDTVLSLRRRIEGSLERVAEYQKAYLRLREDFSNAAARTVRDVDGSPLAVFLYDGYTRRIEFTRAGWSNPALLPRASLERVGYWFDDSKPADKKLVRRSWRVLDRAPRTEPVDTTLLAHVEELQWRFLDPTLQWQDGWPPPNLSTGINPAANPTAFAATPPPLAVELTLRTRDWGKMRLLFRFGAEGLARMQSAAPSLSAP